MDFRLTSEQEDFRKGFVAWLEKNIPDDFDPSRRRSYETEEDLKTRLHRLPETAQ